MVGPDNEWECRALKPVMPFLLCEDHHQQFPVSHIVVGLRQGQLSAEEDTGVELEEDQKKTT